MKLTINNNEPMEPQLMVESSPSACTKLNDLSDPIILLILKHLNAVDICAVAETSRRMRAIAKDHTLWRNVVIDLSTKSLGSDKGQSTVSKVVDGYLSDGTSSLEIRPLERERNLQVETMNWTDDGKPWMRVEKQPPISASIQMLITVGRKCSSLEKLRLVDCALDGLPSEDWEEIAHLAKLKCLVFQWCVAGRVEPIELSDYEDGLDEMGNGDDEGWEYWIGSLAILAPALRTLCFLDCFDSTIVADHEPPPMYFSRHLALDISEFKCLEELTISENTKSERRQKGYMSIRVSSFALVDWHGSFNFGSESLKKLTINSYRVPPEWLYVPIQLEFCRLQNLQVLDVRGSKLTRGHVKTIKQNLPNCEVLQDEN